MAITRQDAEALASMVKIVFRHYGITRPSVPLIVDKTRACALLLFKDEGSVLRAVDAAVAILIQDYPAQ